MDPTDDFLWGTANMNSVVRALTALIGARFVTCFCRSCRGGAQATILGSKQVAATRASGIDWHNDLLDEAMPSSTAARLVKGRNLLMLRLLTRKAREERLFSTSW